MRVVHSILAVLFSIILLLPFGGDAAAVELPECRGPEPRVQHRPELGGTYMADGWEFGFIEVLTINAVGSQLQGHLQVYQYDEGTTYYHDTYSVSGIYDDDSISFVITGLLTNITAIGNWSSSGISVTWPTNEGEAVRPYLPVEPTTAEEILSLWANHDTRQGAYEYLVNRSLPIFQQSPIDIYNSAIRVIVTLILPYAFLSYFPALVLLDRDSSWRWRWLGFCTPLAALWVVLVTRFVWGKALNRYQGVGH